LKMNKMMAASAAVAALVVGAPAAAQDAAEAASTGSENESYSTVYDVYDSTVENDLIDATLGSTVGDVNSNNSYDYDYVVSTQTLISANANQNFEEMIDVDTYEDYIELSTGDNYIDGSAFTRSAHNMRGSMGSSRKDFEIAQKLLVQNIIPIEKYVSFYDFDEVMTAFEDAISARAVKAVVKI